ncbi:MAG: hypothetical protein ACXAEL_10485 [Candidatus Hodarchaeales archaeon]
MIIKAGSEKNSGWSPLMAALSFAHNITSKGALNSIPLDPQLRMITKNRHNQEISGLNPWV